MSLGCCCLRRCQDADSEDEEKTLTDSNNNYHKMLQNLCKELEKKKAELERLESQSEDSEDVEGLMRYGGQGEGRRRRKGDRGKHKQEESGSGSTSRGQSGVTTRRNTNNNRIGQSNEGLLVDIPLDNNETANDLTTLQDGGNYRRHSTPDGYDTDVKQRRHIGLLCGWDRQGTPTKPGYQRTSL